MACGMHNWGINSFVCAQFSCTVQLRSSVVAPNCLDLAEQEERQGASIKGFVAVGVVSGLCR